MMALPSCNRPSPIKGDRLNDFFPKDGDQHTVVVTTEQSGFAQASLKAADKEVATLAISDLLKDPEAMKKFDAATAKISGFRSLARGSAGTAVLAGRFQVQVRSMVETFTEADRVKWLEKFDLSGLANLR